MYKQVISGKILFIFKLQLISPIIETIYVENSKSNGGKYPNK